MNQSISVVLTLDGVTPEAPPPRWASDEPILRLGDVDVVFPRTPELAAEIALDMIECLNEIRNAAIGRALTREASPAEVRHERLTEGAAS